MKKGPNELINAVIKEETAISIIAIAVDVACDGRKSSVLYVCNL
jgi:hypothetical protein